MLLPNFSQLNFFNSLRFTLRHTKDWRRDSWFTTATVLLQPLIHPSNLWMAPILPSLVLLHMFNEWNSRSINSWCHSEKCAKIGIILHPVSKHSWYHLSFLYIRLVHKTLWFTSLEFCLLYDFCEKGFVSIDLNHNCDSHWLPGAPANSNQSTAMSRAEHNTWNWV